MAIASDWTALIRTLIGLGRAKSCADLQRAAHGIALYCFFGEQYACDASGHVPPGPVHHATDAPIDARHKDCPATAWQTAHGSAGERTVACLKAWLTPGPLSPNAILPATEACGVMRLLADTTVQSGLAALRIGGQLDGDAAVVTVPGLGSLAP